MKENSSTCYSSWTIGIDLGDRRHAVCVLDCEGEAVKRRTISNSRHALSRLAGEYPGALMVMEVGTHSPWIARHLGELGVEVLVANARKLKAISRSATKNDLNDAEMLARLGRADPKLLSPITHRNEECQRDLSVIKSRDALVGSRTALINHVRGSLKSHGLRLPACNAAAFARKAPGHLEACDPALVEEVIASIGELTERIKARDKEIGRLCEEKYPETRWLMSVPGVGPITALAFVLRLESPKRFPKPREVAPFLGLTPRQDSSGARNKQLRISKHGDALLRRLLVNCAQYILGPFGPESALRSHGLELSARGGKNAKKRAVVATARKLSVILLTLWSDQAEYKAYPA